MLRAASLSLSVQKTHAHRNLKDDVPEEVKKARFQVLYDFVRCEMERLHKGYLGTQQLVLIEGVRQDPYVQLLLCSNRFLLGQQTLLRGLHGKER